MIKDFKKREIDQEIIKYFENKIKEINQNLEVPENPRACISKYSAELKLKPETEEKALEIFEVLGDLNLTPYKKPNTIAGAVLYFAAKFTQEKLTFKKITEVAKIGKRGILKRHKELKSKINF